MIKRTRPIKPSKNSIWDGLRWIPGPAIKTRPEGIWRPKKAAPIKRTAIKKVSKKQSKLNREYTALRRTYIFDHPMCECESCHRQATELHHRRGRGKFFLDTSTWMAVCQDHHREIHDNPALARVRGWMLSRR